MDDFLNQGFETIPTVKLAINIGCLMDIPTGTYLKGIYGESLLLGGLTGLSCVCGGPNTFKSTISHYMMLSAANHIFSNSRTSISTYDTEINIHIDRLQSFADKFTYLKDKDVIHTGIWAITDKTKYTGDEWYKRLKEFLKAKKDNAKKIEVETPFIASDRKSRLRTPMITFSELDSFTEFGTAVTNEMQAKNDLGSSETNTLHMKNGLVKSNLMMELPGLAGNVNHSVLFTAHIGKEISMASGPYAPQPTKKLQHLKVGEKLNNVPNRFLFLMNLLYQTVSAAQLNNQGTKGIEYPKDSAENATKSDGDLNIVTVKLLRSKSGPSGGTIDVIVSQREGVLPSLTEFHYIKEHDRFGISGTLQSYSLDLYPEVKLSRTTVRSKIDNDLKLQRALNITAELLQMHIYYRYMSNELCTPKEMYDYLTKEGYDINMLLEVTRGWWAFDNDNHPTHVFLSTLDLVKMCTDQSYYPYWLEDDKKTIKPQYRPTTLNY